MSTPRFAQAAAIVRAQVADGTLKPGQPAPSGAHLARVTGFSQDTCVKALRALTAEGTLTRGVSRERPPPRRRPRQPASRRCGRGAVAGAGRAAPRGRAVPGPACRPGRHSVTTVGHAETGRVWQSRAFWEKADAVLAAAGS